MRKSLIREEQRKGRGGLEKPGGEKGWGRGSWHPT